MFWIGVKVTNRDGQNLATWTYHPVANERGNAVAAGAMTKCTPSTTLGSAAIKFILTNTNQKVWAPPQVFYGGSIYSHLIKKHTLLYRKFFTTSAIAGEAMSGCLRPTILHSTASIYHIESTNQKDRRRPQKPHLLRDKNKILWAFRATRTSRPLQVQGNGGGLRR